MLSVSLKSNVPFGVFSDRSMNAYTIVIVWVKE